MGILTIDGHVLRKAIIEGANELSKHRDYVDGLNVFPVPDGDTGINMSLTVIAAAREVEKLNTPNIYDIAKAASNGSLRGARGNSGVILSQLFRGFAKGLSGKSTANAEDIADAFVKGMETAYKAVMKPKEGTILTVARAIGENAVELSFDIDDIDILIHETIKRTLKVLEQTQQMLPELKQAGVVDAGGRGLLYVFEGAYNSLSIEGEIKVLDPSQSQEQSHISQPVSNFNAADIKFGYCTEFFINTENVTEQVEDGFRNFLAAVGDSIVVAGDEDIIKVHVHTNHPGKVLEKALAIGSLSNMKIDNMRLQHTNLISFSQSSKPQTEDKIPEEKKELGFISVSMGSGLCELFKSLGADYIIEGGQSMNPSTEDLLQAIEKVNADHIVILPNNKNIILAAEQAAKLSNKNVYVIPSKTIPQGIAALINHTIGENLENNLKHIAEAVDTVKTGQVTYAVRDSNFEGKEITDGDILCMVEGKIQNVAKDIEVGTKELIDIMFEGGTGDILSIYYGEDIKQEDADTLAAYIEEKHSGCEVEVISGGQPLYYYILSLE